VTEGRRRRTGWFGAIGVLAVAVLILGAGIGGLWRGWQPEVTGRAVPAETILGTDGSPAPLAIRHVGEATSFSTSDDAVVAGVLADLGTFWSRTLPADFGKPFVPLTGGYSSIDATARSVSSRCVSTPDQIAGNAYYCPDGDSIVWDSAGLVPVLLGHYGAAGLTAAFAHEFGHAIQARIGPTVAERTAHPTQYASLVIEAQGDCFAGAFLAWTVSGAAVHVRLPQSSMVRAVAPLLDFRDPIDTAAKDPSAHGLSLDRLSALLTGFRRGARACHSMTAGTLPPATLGRASVSTSLSTSAAVPRFAGADAVDAAARQSVRAFAAGLPGTAAADLPQTPLPADVAAARPFGQFARAATTALATGHSITGTPVGAACFTGAWAASVFGSVPSGSLGSWAGDADEALDLIRARPGADFDDLAGYADGFARGWSACAGR